VFEHATLDDLAAASTVPVINGLSDHSHPCQALADLLTIRDAFGEPAGRRVVYIGDANNVMRSLAAACDAFGLSFVACCPEGFGPPATSGIAIEPDPAKAADGADVLYTDTWTSMGQEAEKKTRIEAFAGYTIDADLVARAKPEAVVLHCLPAYRGLEITDEVMRSPRSRIFEQAHNRLHAQKGLLCELMGAG
jgi:ornithine carbamoyltransferase